MKDYEAARFNKSQENALKFFGPQPIKSWLATFNFGVLTQHGWKITNDYNTLTIDIAKVEFVDGLYKLVKGKKVILKLDSRQLLAYEEKNLWRIIKNS
ncbi:hypothetical protein [Lactobacillus sp. PSON]|uniref:hypothetical protein n=1 Tax=Lactobacillus sp. PSON TaxID=3455454 RepID=UPI004041A0CE